LFFVNEANEQNNEVQIEKYGYKYLEANCTTYSGLYQRAEAVQINDTSIIKSE